MQVQRLSLSRGAARGLLTCMRRARSPGFGRAAAAAGPVLEARTYGEVRPFHATRAHLESKRDYYEVLGVQRGADKAEIKKNYYKLAKTMHPDVNKDDPDAASKFAELQEAYEVLSDEEKRAGYDQFGHAAGGQNPFGGHGGGNPFGGQGVNPEDLFRNFSDIFGGGAQQRNPNAPQRGSDVQTVLRLNFMDAVNGCKKDVTFRHAKECGTCNGTGAKPGTGRSTCSVCGGSGQRTISRGFFQMRIPCDACDGLGTRIESPCVTCGGNGRTTESKTVSVTIPAGVDTGVNMRLAHQGDDGVRGGPAGHLFVEIEVSRDTFFKRDGADVHTEIPIRFSQAALGGS